MGKLIDLTGMRFGEFNVIEHAGLTNDGCSNALWRCICDCGTIFIEKSAKIRNGSILACNTCVPGEEEIKAKKSHKRAYRVWVSMKYRCYNSKATGFKRYGGRGIKVCDRWKKSFKAFHDDMGDPPEGMQIDRIDNNGNYTKNNCRWATPQENVRNSTVTPLTADDAKIIKFALNFTDMPYDRLAEMFSVSFNTIQQIKLGYSWGDIGIFLDIDILDKKYRKNR